MDALIVLLILFPLIFLILLLLIHSKASAQQEVLREVRKKLDDVSQQLSDMQFDLQKKERPQEKIIIAEKEEIIPEVKPYVPPTPVVEIKKGPLQEEVPVLQTLQQEIDERKYTEESKSFFKKNTDMEKFIGENLANKIGIAVLVLGISFFVKYAIDKNWINETGRVLIGLVSGGILIGLAHYIRGNYRSFSSVLIGGGLTVFYFTTAYAFHQYQLIGQRPTFITMVVITAFAVLLSLYYKRQELAILATIGGFITPFLVTTGQENYIALFTYLCILNTGLMILAWFKRWPAINIIALFFTTIIYGGWLIKRTVFDDSETLPYKDAFLFATIFYLLFITMNIINNIRLKRKFLAFDFIIVLSTNFLYYITSILILKYSNIDYKGVFTLSLGVFNLILAAIFYSKKSIDKNFVSLLIGLALSFISLTPFIQFEGHHVALFWAAEAVVLLWLYLRSRIIHLKVASFFVVVLMLISLVSNWLVVYLQADKILPVILNKGFITTFTVSISLFIYYILLRKDKEEYYLKEISNHWVKNILLVLAFIVMYSAGAWEICYQFSTRFPQTDVYAVYLQAYSFTAAIIILQLRKRSTHFAYLKFLLTALSLGLYLFHLFINYNVSIALLNNNNSVLFIAHWVAAILLLWLLYDLVRFFFTNSKDRWADHRSTFTWIATISIVLVLSVEMYHVILWTNVSNENDWAWWENLYYKAGLSILWSICSFVMIWLGMKFDFRTLRIISLSLFTLTLVKLFSYDIRNIPPGGKIAAFILLGVLLLTVSFMYQRLKKILIDNAAR
ncbi:MAG: DUF2339 domain-containing protein [Chitinophagaceae bacterium]